VQRRKEAFVAGGEDNQTGWRARRSAAKRAKAERTGDSPQKRAERKSRDADVKDAASGAAVRGSVSAPPGVGGLGGGGM
jgi:hypothetical protein